MEPLETNNYVRMHLDILIDGLNEVESGSTWSLNLIENLLDSYSELSNFDLNTIDIKTFMPELEKMNTKVQDLCQNHFLSGAKAENDLMKRVKEVRTHIADSNYMRAKTDVSYFIKDLHELNSKDLSELDVEDVRNGLTDVLDRTLDFFDKGLISEEEKKEIKEGINQFLNKTCSDYLSELPSEVLEIIFLSQLGPEDLANMKLTSKRYLGFIREVIGKNEAMQSDKVKKKLVNRMIEQEKTRSTFVNRLKFWVKQPDLDPQAKAILMNVTSLTLDGDEVSKELLQKIEKYCPNIEHLELKDSERIGRLPEEIRFVTDDILDFIPSGVTSFRLNDCQIITEKGLKKIGTLKDLKSLSLNNVLCITDESLSALSDLTELTSLDLSHNNINGSGLVHLGKLTNLRSLNLNPNSITCENLQYLALFPDLETLALGNPAIFAEGLQHVKTLKNLKELKLISGNRHVLNDEGIAHLEEMELETLNIYQAPDITDQSMKSIGKIKSLKKLKLWSISGVYNAGVKELSSLENLEELELSGTFLNNDGLHHLKKLPKLEKCVFGSSDLTEESFEVFRAFPALKFINFQFTTGITKERAKDFQEETGVIVER